jgi:hypothetical protein
VSTIITHWLTIDNYTYTYSSQTLIISKTSGTFAAEV